jgi:hypothetical protein
MESGFVVNKYLYTVASVALNYDARNHELKKKFTMFIPTTAQQ